MGTQTHSNVSASNSYLIFACHNDKQAQGTLDDLNISHKVCHGSYKGEPEKSWLVNLEHFNILKAAGILTKQESVLILGPWIGSVSGHRPATLQFLDGSPSTSLGYVVPVSKEEALSEEAYTETEGQYFICKHTYK